MRSDKLIIELAKTNRNRSYNMIVVYYLLSSVLSSHKHVYAWDVPTIIIIGYAYIAYMTERASYDFSA